jgi:hypothetical protein
MRTRIQLINSSIIMFFVLLSACSNSNKEKLNPAQDISGTWRWISTYWALPLSDSNPLTPQNTGIEELLVFKINHNWYKTENNVKTDSGTYSIGHGSWLAGGAFLFTYDSIVYYQNGFPVDSGRSCDYYKIMSDTLHFTPYYGARFSSYMLPHNGGKFWRRQN